MIPFPDDISLIIRYFIPIHTSCHFLNKSVEEWVAATILAVKEVAVPHTELKMRYYKVSFSLESPDNGHVNQVS
jgi:hypothetical protein